MATQTDKSGYLVTEKLVKRFDEAVAVDEVSLSIAQGEIFALLGSSGCGKSTLLRMLAGFESPTSGRILLGGQDVAKLPPYERPINMMFQSYALFPHLDLWENVAFGLKREGLPRDEIKQRVGEMLDLVQLVPMPSASPISSRVDSSSVWRWPAVWPNALSCCYWMNRWAPWTRSCVSKRSLSWSTSLRKWA